MTPRRVDVSIGELPDLPNAVCKNGVDPEIFFPTIEPRWTGSWRDQGEDARYACSRCPERLPCLEWALAHDVSGIWGGTSDLQRKRILKDRKSA